MSASNFFGDWVVYTRLFFPLTTDHHGATTIFVFKVIQRGIFMNKVAFPKADKPGLMSA